MLKNLEERKNYLRLLLNSYSELLLFVHRLIIFVVNYLQRKITPVINEVDKNVRQVIKSKVILTFEEEVSAGKIRLDLKNIPEISCLSLVENELQGIKLASTTIPVTINLDWTHSFPDIEDCFALHRFGWLLSALARYPSVNLATKGLTWLNSWVQEMGKPRRGPVWESYSVAERLSNWPFILAIINRIVAIPPSFLVTIEDAMIALVDYLLHNLEFRGRLTNNHLLNNARGLYIAGLTLGSQVAVQKAKEIFEGWTANVFYEDGMLREKSSHYQYLLCQRYEQVYLLSGHVQDRQFQKFMGKWFGLMKESCEFFSVYSLDGSWDMPLIGDISPDFPPGWLSPNPKSEWAIVKRLCGWLEIPREQPYQLKTLEIKKGGFIRYSQGEVVLFWHINTEDPGFLGHGHYDLGSFVLFYRGKQVIIDPGRFSYAKEGSFGVGARAHSTLMIDSLGALCEDHLLNSINAYGRRMVKYRLSESQQEFDLEIETDGFKRLGTPVGWKRRFTVGKSKVIITDILESRGSNRVETRFLVSSGFEVQEFGRGFKITSASAFPLMIKVGDGNPYRHELFSGDAKGEEGWIFQEYGQRSPGTTILFHSELNHRQVNTYEIIWQ